MKVPGCTMYQSRTPAYLPARHLGPTFTQPQELPSTVWSSLEWLAALTRNLSATDFNKANESEKQLQVVQKMLDIPHLSFLKLTI